MVLVVCNSPKSETLFLPEMIIIAWDVWFSSVLLSLLKVNNSEKAELQKCNTEITIHNNARFRRGLIPIIIIALSTSPSPRSQGA